MSHGQNVPRTKRPTDKTSGTKSKCPKGQIVLRDKMSQGDKWGPLSNTPANYLIQYDQDKGMTERNLPKIRITLSINWVHFLIYCTCGLLPIICCGCAECIALDASAVSDVDVCAVAFLLSVLLLQKFCFCVYRDCVGFLYSDVAWMLLQWVLLL